MTTIASTKRGGEEVQMVRERGGILHIFTNQAHISGLANGENPMEGGWNVVEGKKVSTSDTCDRLNISIARG